MSQQTTNRELFNGENVCVGANMSPSDTPDGQSSIAAVATSDGPRSHYKTRSAPTINGLKQNRYNHNASKLIIKFLAAEGLNTTQRNFPEPTYGNPSGYRQKKLIIDGHGIKIVRADDGIYHYMHDQDNALHCHDPLSIE